MKRRFATTRNLFPEEAARGAENPWFTRPGQKTGGLRAKKSGLTTVELCAGAGGQALSYEQAGIDHAALIDIDKHACNTLRLNRPQWNVIEQNIDDFEGSAFLGVDIVSGGLPCPPFSVAGKQLGPQDERNLFPHAFRPHEPPPGPRSLVLGPRGRRLRHGGQIEPVGAVMQPLQGWDSISAQPPRVALGAQPWAE